MNKFTAIIATSLFAGLTLSAVAGPLHREERRDDRRIAQGIRNGELTRGEAQSLRQERRAIHTEQHAYRADGKLDVAERKDLHQDLNQFSRDIYAEKHDAEKR